MSVSIELGRLERDSENQPRERSAVGNDDVRYKYEHGRIHRMDPKDIK